MRETPCCRALTPPGRNPRPRTLDVKQCRERVGHAGVQPENDHLQLGGTDPPLSYKLGPRSPNGVGAVHTLMPKPKWGGRNWEAGWDEHFSGRGIGRYTVAALKKAKNQTQNVASKKNPRQINSALNHSVKPLFVRTS